MLFEHMVGIVRVQMSKYVRRGIFLVASLQGFGRADKIFRGLYSCQWECRLWDSFTSSQRFARFLGIKSSNSHKKPAVDPDLLIESVRYLDTILHTLA